MIIEALFSLALADPVTIISGVQIGDSPQSAQRVVSGRLADITGKPGAQMLWNDAQTVGFCHGQATSIQRIVGRDIHAFTDSVQDMTQRLGAPVLEANHYRTASGEISTIKANWPLEGGQTYSFSMIQTEAGPVDVSEGLALDRPPC